MSSFICLWAKRLKHENTHTEQSMATLKPTQAPLC